MPKNKDVPDAWDDDWEAQADKAEANPQPAPEPEPALNKSQRLAMHNETNRKLWESAETPQTFHYLEATSSLPPATTTFRPQVKVLSRKPVLAKRGGTQSQATADEEEDEEAKKAQPTPEEIRARQKRDLEEKQRRYDEARAKIFGESAPSSGASTPGTVTPPRGTENSPRGRGRGRGGRGNGNNSGGGHSNASGNNEGRRQNQQQGIGNRELFDPNYAQRRPDEGPARMNSAAGKDEQAPIRTPKGPDGSGRGGFGFARGRGRGT
ncbi:SUZ domain-containing protein [Sarocladium implicatum]|nr:SUZ domain-containing protein [Sarocladium implicatum]